MENINKLLASFSKETLKAQIGLEEKNMNNYLLLGDLSKAELDTLELHDALLKDLKEALTLK